MNAVKVIALAIALLAVALPAAARDAVVDGWRYITGQDPL